MDVPPLNNAIVSRPAPTALPEDSTIRVRRWRLLGLILWLLLVPVMLPRAIAAGNEYINDFGGPFASVNFPGPKVWAVPLLQRSLGTAPEALGASITVFAIANVLAIWLLTMPSQRQPSTLAAATRWTAIVGVGALFGMLLHAGSIRRLWTSETDLFALIALVTELLATTLLYFWLASEARRLNRPLLARRLGMTAIAIACLILMAFPAAIAYEYFESRADNLPLQIASAVYGIMAVTIAALAATLLLQLVPPLYCAAFPRGILNSMNLQTRLATDPLCGECGYDRRGSASDAACPECGSSAVINLDHEDAHKHEKHWARFVVAGLIALLLLVPENLYVILAMDFNQLFGGTPAMVNFTGPKVWGVSALQRVIGREPRALGVNGAMYILLNLAAVWFITWPHTATALNEKWNSLRRLTRWSAVVGVGAFFGFTLLGRNVATYEPGYWKWIFVAILSAELPGTVLLYLYLARLSIGRLPRATVRLSAITSMLAAALMVLALFMLPLGEPFAGLHEHMLVKAFFGAYGAACLAGGLLGAVVVLRLVVALWPMALPRRLVVVTRRLSAVGPTQNSNSEP